MAKNIEIRTGAEGHLIEDALEEYAFHRLPDDDTATVEEHLLICADCRFRLHNIDEFIHAMRSCGEEAILHPAGPSRARIAGYGAALLVAAFGLLMVAWYPGRTTPAAKPVQLIAFRGGEAGALIQASADAPLNLSVDVADLNGAGIYRLVIVDAAGKEVRAEESRASSGKLEVPIAHGLRSGVYWIRLYSQGELVREFGLRAQ